MKGRAGTRETLPQCCLTTTLAPQLHRGFKSPYVTVFNSEQYQPQLSVKYEWSRVPHQEHQRALVAVSASPKAPAVRTQD